MAGKKDFIWSPLFRRESYTTGYNRRPEDWALRVQRYASTGQKAYSLNLLDLGMPQGD